MNYYTLLYIIAISLSIYGGILIFKVYKNYFGFFFLLFTIFASTRFFCYYFFFSGISNTIFLLYLSRIGYGIGVLATYSLVFSLLLYNFGKKTYPT